jgi:LuxR family transcriptional regulator, quorum-sensing system regulator SdiA
MPPLQVMRSEILEIAPAGFYVALRVGFSFPEEELNCLPENWVEFYTTHGLVVHDPAMKWVYGNTGAARLSDIPDPDPHRIRAHAAIFGLSHGAAVSVMAQADRGRRSYGLFYRDDRNFDQADIDHLQRIMQDMHTGNDADPGLTPAEIEALRMQAAGMRLKQVAGELGISESAVKARLNNAKRKLGAKTLSQAASMAASRRIL